MATTSSGAATYRQGEQLATFHSTLGDDKLLLKHFLGEEAVSTPYLFTCDLLSEDAAIRGDALLRSPASVQLTLEDGSKRAFHGRIRRFTQLDSERGLTQYRAEVVPWLWFLSLSSDCRIFQNKTVPEIITQVFKDLGHSDFKSKLTGSYTAREYCVQYRESHLAFVSRLMEEEGIFYFFEHTPDKHVLVLVDASSTLTPCPAQPTARMLDPTVDTGEDGVISVRLDANARTGKVTQSDFDPLTLVNLEVEMAGQAGASEELYDYPGEYAKRADGERYTRVRIEEQEALRTVLEGESSCRGFLPGHRFDLAGHYRGDLNAQYQLLRVTHELGVGTFRGDGGSAGYTNSFTCIPAAVPFRPARQTPRPVVQGSQTAMVTGPAGEEIYPDKYSRVKVQFHWDRRGKKDESSSCWVRVSSVWAGKGFGFVHIPRIGEEVIVDFLEGDPDRPLVTGRVYNAKAMPPWPLPEMQTKSGFHTRSSKGGASSNYNELRFEDKKGSEEIFIHAEKDKRVVVENDRSEQVGHDETIGIGNNRTETVEKDETITIGQNRTESVGKDESISIGANQTIDVGADQRLEVGKKRTTQIGTDDTRTVGSNDSVRIGKNGSTQVGKKYILEAGDEIVLKTGDASITMKKDGTITIKGKDISISGSGKINAKASSDVVIKGSKVVAN